jgi:hypothetical protein
VTIRDLVWAVQGYCDGAKAVKPRGSEHVDVHTPGPDLANQPWQFVFAHVTGLRMSDVSCHQAVPLQRQDRGMLLLDHVNDGAFADLRGLPPPTGLAAIDVRECNGLHGLSNALRTGAPVISGMETGATRTAIQV